MGKGRIGETEKILRKRGQEGGGLVKNISGGGGPEVRPNFKKWVCDLG